MADLVSVIIPTFNRRGLLLNRALPSVQGQTHDNLEIICCNHGSIDGTSDALFWEWLHDHRIQEIVVPRRRHYPDTARNKWLAGPVDPINAGLKAAGGDWIARIDDDDIWYPDHIERLLSFAQSGDYEFVSSQYVAERNGIRYVVDGEGTPKIGGTQTWLYRSYLRFMRYNRDCWRKSWHAVNDTDIAERMRRAGVRIGYLDETTALVTPRPGEQTIGLAAYLRQERQEQNGASL